MERVADRLAGQACAAAAGQHRDPMPARVTLHFRDIGLIFGKHDAQRRDLVDAGIGRVQCPRKSIQLHIAMNATAESRCHYVVLAR